MKRIMIISSLTLGFAMGAMAQTPAKIAVFKVRKVKMILEQVEESPATNPKQNANQRAKAPFGRIDTSEVFVSVEEPPTFPGGDDALRTFIAQNVDYPEQARELEIQGRVYVRFCVTYKGTIEQVSVLRGVHSLLDAAAIAVVKKLPKWTPGKQGGKWVNVWYTVPINFLLQQ